ncbi:MAG: phytanoyl-CoA dioxygenase family protein [Pseudomonadota bacterium]
MQQNVTITYQEVPRFNPGDPAAMDYLEEEGFVVFANALSNDEAAQSLSMLWDYLEELGTGIDRNDIDTWGDERWPTAVHGAILPSHGIGHCAAQWFIRDVPNVKTCFGQVWDTEELLVSFDGVTIWRPWTHNEAWRTNEGNSWLHIDQHPIGRPGKHCVQGLVNLLPTSPATGGNVVVPGSHRSFEHIPEKYAERLARIHPSIDHFRYPKDDPLLSETNPIMCHMEAGDLLLWDSRTIHCSAPGLERPADSHSLLRAASLICMMPKAKSNPKVLEARKAAVATRTSTTNWSDRFINADEFPQILDAPDRDKYQWPPEPKLNHNQLLMVGWDEAELKSMAS